jgi:hypothetical protein|tara:strand:+ start:10238 stop:10438 length:201 start_codon:yes stop_codon:yes gene_type:complete
MEIVDIKNLKELKNFMDEIASGWNGKDDRFTAGGVVYDEDDAHAADEISDKAKELIKLLEEFYNLN